MTALSLQEIAPDAIRQIASFLPVTVLLALCSRQLNSIVPIPNDMFGSNLPLQALRDGSHTVFEFCLETLARCAALSLSRPSIPGPSSQRRRQIRVS